MDLGLIAKRVIVQGASTGIGLSVAKAYAQEGAKVFICSRDEYKIMKAAAEIPNAFHYAIDLDERGAGRRCIEKALEVMGGVDILFTNTGGPPKGSIETVSIEEWQLGYDRVFASAVESVQAALPYMKGQKWGRIIFNTSTAAKQPIPNLSVSGALRAGLLGLMKSLSLEVAPWAITVNAVLPGYTRTERLFKLGIPEEDLCREIPLGRLANPEELASLALFLGSKQAGYITGQAIACDGGLLRGL